MTIWLNSPLPAYFFRERANAFFYGDLDGVTIARINKQEPIFRLLVGNNRNGIDQLISDLFCGVVTGLLVRLAPSQGRDVGQVRSVGKPDFSAALDSSESDRIVPWLKSQKNLIQLLTVEINRAFDFSLKTRKERGVTKNTRKEHFYCLPQSCCDSNTSGCDRNVSSEVTDFHGLLLGVMKFCLTPQFSHALGKAFPVLRFASIRPT
nr:MAG TPA: hypothetical protein [Caudoviricetes sp.]